MGHGERSTERRSPSYIEEVLDGSRPRARSSPATSPSGSARRARGGTGTTARSRSSTCSGPGRSRPPGGRATSPGSTTCTERVIPRRGAGPPGAARARGPQGTAGAGGRPPRGRRRSATSPTTTARSQRACKPLVDELVEEGGCCAVQRRGLGPAGVPASRAPRPPRRVSARALLSPFDPLVLEPRARRAVVRLPLPDRDLHAAAEADVRLLRVAVPAGRRARRPGRPEGRPAGRQRCWCRRRSPSQVCRQARWQMILRLSCARWPDGWARATSTVMRAATWPPPFASAVAHYARR